MVELFKKDDLVVVISGKDKNKEGKIIKVLPELDKVIVAGINVASRHMKPSMNQKGGIVKKELAIHRSNLMHKDPETGKPTRIRIEEEGDKKCRVAVVSGKKIDSKN